MSQYMSNAQYVASISCKFVQHVVRTKAPHTSYCIMYGSILPVTIPPPGNSGDKSSPSVPGVGNCLKPSCPGGRGVGQIENNFLLFPRSCAVRHFSVDAGPRGEDCLFPGRISRICSRLAREDNLSKLKSVFERTFILNC